MSTFSVFSNAVTQKLSTMTANQRQLFRTERESDALWDTYLAAFPDGTNEIYVKRRAYDCSACRSFIRSVGNVVHINNDYSIDTIWDLPDLPYPFNVVAEKMSAYVKGANINTIFSVQFQQVGVKQSVVFADDKVTIANTWNHFNFKFDSCYLYKSNISELNDLQKTLLRAMTENTIESAEVVLDLISQNSLYRGIEFKPIVEHFVATKKKYQALSEEQRNNWAWLNHKNSSAKFRDTSIGTLVDDIDDGMDLDCCVRRYEAKVAPENYRRTSSIVTKKMLSDAESLIVSLGFSKSLQRRFCVMDDIKANNVIFMNRSIPVQESVSPLAALKDTLNTPVKTLSKVDEVSAEDFFTNILPNVTDIEVLFESRLQPRLMSLIAPVDMEAPSMFSWDNAFSWSYNGNIADSSIRENVKHAGGNVVGELRCSLQWNENKDNNNDFDLHCIPPYGAEIMFQNKGVVHKNSGKLDVDIINPFSDSPNRPAVENIIFTNRNIMPVGEYRFFVHNFNDRGGTSGFRAEIEFDGETIQFDYPHPIRHKYNVDIATVKYTKANGFQVVKSLNRVGASSREIWGIKSNTFNRVSMIMNSPNFWDGKTSGNKHVFFIIDKCKNPDSPRGFFNEYLKPELHSVRKAFELIGAHMTVAASNDQLSGIGVSVTQHDSITLKVSGKFNRTIKVMF